MDRSSYDLEPLSSGFGPLQVFSLGDVGRTLRPMEAKAGVIEAVAVLTALSCSHVANDQAPRLNEPRAPSVPAFHNRVDLRIDCEEAELVLDLAERAGRVELIPEEDWQKLLATDGYRRLVRRERSLGRELSEEDFRAFVRSETLAQGAAALRATLEAWKQADLDASARHALAYLPPEARIRAVVLPVVKPKKNSFVFEPSTDPAIFLAVDPALTRAQFENVVAHELHHIGFASLPPRGETHPPEVERVLPWVGAFGEGFAMLAAAGGPDVHPHEHSPPADRERWDRDVAGFDQDLHRVQVFFLDIVDGRLVDEGNITKAGMEFFGEQGPYYTVGWKMAVVVETAAGRGVLIEAMRDPRRLLATYNAIAEKQVSGGEKLPLWSPQLLEHLGAKPIETALTAPSSRPASPSR